MEAQHGISAEEEAEGACSVEDLRQWCLCSVILSVLVRNEPFEAVPVAYSAPWGLRVQASPAPRAARPQMERSALGGRAPGTPPPRSMRLLALSTDIFTEQLD